jgi:hypothetical protein
MWVGQSKEEACRTSGPLAHNLMARNNRDDVDHCGKSLQTLNEDSGDQLYRYYRYLPWSVVYLGSM